MATRSTRNASMAIDLKMLGTFDQTLYESLEEVELALAWSPGEGTRLKPIPKLLLVDDNPMFCELMIRASRKLDLPLTTCTSTKALTKLPLWDFDVVILDYDLGSVSGVQLAQVFEQRRRALPILLVSEYRSIELKGWTGFHCRFIPKKEGLVRILDEALRLFDTRPDGPPQHK